MDTSDLRTFSQAVIECQDIAPGISEPVVRKLHAQGALADAVVNLGGRYFLVLSKLRPLLENRSRKTTRSSRNATA